MNLSLVKHNIFFLRHFLDANLAMSGIAGSSLNSAANQELVNELVNELVTCACCEEKVLCKGKYR